MLTRSLPIIKLGILMSLPAPLVILGSVWVGLEAFFFGFVLWAAFALSLYYLSDKAALKVCDAVPVTARQFPELHRTIEEVSLRAGLPMPRVYMMPGDAPNIFSVGRDRHTASLVVTEGLLREVTSEELRCAIAHELVHLYYRETMLRSALAVFAALLGANSQVVRAEVGGESPGVGKRHSLAASLFSSSVPLAAMAVRLLVTPREELRADRLAAKLLSSPLTMANAIRTMEKKKNILSLQANPSVAHMFLVSPLRHSRMAQLFKTHPSLEERVRCLNELAEDRSSSPLALSQG